MQLGGGLLNGNAPEGPKPSLLSGSAIKLSRFERLPADRHGSNQTHGYELGPGRVPVFRLSSQWTASTTLVLPQNSNSPSTLLHCDPQRQAAQRLAWQRALVYRVPLCEYDHPSPILAASLLTSRVRNPKILFGLRLRTAASKVPRPADQEAPGSSSMAAGQQDSAAGA